MTLMKRPTVIARTTPTAIATNGNGDSKGHFRMVTSVGDDKEDHFTEALDGKGESDFKEAMQGNCGDNTVESRSNGSANNGNPPILETNIESLVGIFLFFIY